MPTSFSSDESIFYFVAAPAIILGIIYLIFMVFALIRFKKVLFAVRANKISLLFYLFVAMETILRIALYLYIALQSYIFSISPRKTDNPMDDKTFLTFEYLPDMFFWIIFTLLLWQLLVLFYSSHINNNATYHFIAQVNPNSKKKYFVCFLFAWVAYFIIELMFISLYQSDVISIRSFSEQNSMFNLLLPFILFVIEVHLHITFSGTPYISLLASHKKGIINKVLVVWAIGRILHAIWSVYLAFYSPSLFYDVMQGGEMDNSTYATLMTILACEIADKIVDEILPFIFVFDIDFVSLFYKTMDPNSNSFNLKNTLTIDSTKETSFSLLSSNQIIIKPPLEFQNLQIINEDDELRNLNRKNGFGVLEFCYLTPDFSRKFIMRKLKMKGLTNYIAEEFIDNLAKYADLQADPNLRLIKLVNYSVQEINNEKFLCLIFDYYANGSIANLLKTQKNLDFQIKAKTALALCSIFQNWHSYDPPLIHGHLGSFNVVFDEEFKPVICDFGFSSLKKYYTIMHSYVQKSIYMAPEALKSNALKREKAIDVYSFGIILYELFVEKISNEGFPNKKLVQMICEEKTRPKIPQDCDNKLANLIRCCWQDEADKRPTFPQIHESLKKILGFQYI